MKPKSIIRNIIILAVVAGLGFAGYKLFFANKTAAPKGSLQTTAGVGTGSTGAPKIATTNTVKDAENAAIGQDFLTTLLSVKSISLDESIFTNRAFLLLQDFNRPIPADENPGRTNPFAPLGVDGGIAQVQVSTSNPSSITATSAVLNGTLSAADTATTRWFEYGPTPTFGALTSSRVQATAGTFAETVDKLLPNTTYYARADAVIGGVTVIGNTVSWKTAQTSR
jgi:hypothetical protein